MAAASWSACCRPAWRCAGRRSSGPASCVVLLGVFLLPQALREFGIEFDPVGAALTTVIPRAQDLVLLLAGYRG